MSVSNNPRPNERRSVDGLGTMVGSDSAGSLPLRIIYTLNSSSQPLLARSKRKSPVIRISKDETLDQTPAFGKVLLRTCLAAVCASSPELLGNPSRDYSIYIVDPLESISGLSVGVGLLSWWLKNDRLPFCNDEDDSDDYAVGKIAMDRGTESLEIVMSLKETTPQSTEDHARSLSFLCLPSSSSAEAVSSPNTLHLKHSTRDVSKTRIGRPSGASTNPEKKARRVALLEQKEKLKRLQNLAKMQRGEPYDSTLIMSNDVVAPKVTQEDIERQQKLVHDLESRPAITRQTTSLLTTKPLPNRSGSLLTPSEDRIRTGSKPPSIDNLFSAYNASSASGETASSSTQAAPVPLSSHSGNIELLYSLFATMLSGASAKPSTKGKETQPTGSIDPALITSLGQLLPFLTARPGFSIDGQNPTPSIISQPRPQLWNHHTTVSGFLSGASQKLFQTADETFHIPNTSSPQPAAHVSDNVTTYGHARSEPPKVREDAYPVPGGGWARGRNLVPRTPVSFGTTTIDQQLEQSSTKFDLGSDAGAGKENQPPPNITKGTKRGSAALLEKESNFPKNNNKKRKAEKLGHTDVKATGIRRTSSASVNATQKSDTLISHPASSPLRSSNSQNRTLSEADPQGSSAPLIATSDFSFPEPPRTPPPKSIDNAINSVEKSLFTPATPVNITAHTNEICTGASLFTPSPILARSQGKSGERSILHSAAIDSEPFIMKPGWDLPPSSPPPPTSPILSPTESVEDRLETTNHETAQDMEKNESVHATVSFESLPSSTLNSELEESQLSLSDDIELDIDELWNSLGPIIVQAQIENAGMPGPSNSNLTSDCNLSHVVPESQNGIDAAKLADDLKALFGGCVV